MSYVFSVPAFYRFICETWAYIIDFMIICDGVVVRDTFVTRSYPKLKISHVMKLFMKFALNVTLLIESQNSKIKIIIHGVINQIEKQ